MAFHTTKSSIYVLSKFSNADGEGITHIDVIIAIALSF